MHADATSADEAQRRAAMATLARAEMVELEVALAHWSPAPAIIDVRPPECGLVLVRGRVGGDGAAFNLGEATVTRAAVQMANGGIGHAYLLGRDPARARLAATFDALWQDPRQRARVEAEVLAPVRARLAREDRESAARTAATRVQFFTMVRGDNA